MTSGEPSDQWAPTAMGVASQLAALSRQLDEAVSNLGAKERDAIQKREDYTAAYASAFLTATGAMDVRRYQATQDTGESRLAAELAEQEVKGLRRQVDTLRLRIDVGRSIGAALRAEVSLTQGGMGP